MSTPKSLVQAEIDRCWWWQRESLVKALEEHTLALDQKHRELLQTHERALQERKVLDEQTRTAAHENSVQKRIEDIDLEYEKWVARRHPEVFSPNWWQQSWQEVKFVTPYAVGTTVVTQLAGAPYWARFCMIYSAILYARNKHRRCRQW
jgi:hypothetical protein